MPEKEIRKILNDLIRMLDEQKKVVESQAKTIDKLAEMLSDKISKSTIPDLPVTTSPLWIQEEFDTTATSLYGVAPPTRRRRSQ